MTIQQQSYGTVTAEAVHGAMDENSTWFKVPDGQPVKIFVCPPWTPTWNLPFYTLKVHHKLKKFPTPCLGEGFCPICKENAILYARKDDPTAQSISKEIYGQDKYLFNFLGDVEPVNTPQGGTLVWQGKDKDGPKVKPYLASRKVRDQIMGIFNVQGNIFDPLNAVPLVIHKIALGKDNWQIQIQPYFVRVRLEDRLLALMNNLPDLSKVMPLESADALTNLLDAKMANYRAMRGQVNTSMISTPVTTVSNPIPNATPINLAPPSNPWGTVTGTPTVPSTTIPSAVIQAAVEAPKPQAPVTIGEAPKAETPVVTPTPVATVVPNAPFSANSLEELEAELARRKAEAKKA